jgi:hypothetical protein
MSFPSTRSAKWVWSRGGAVRTGTARPTSRGPGALLKDRERVANQNGVASRLCVRKRLPLQRLKAPGYFFRVLA